MVAALSALSIINPARAAEDKPLWPSPARPSMPARRVANGSIAIDADFNDWPKASLSPTYMLSADTVAHHNYDNPDRGPWTGRDDSSFDAATAFDDSTLYIRGHVRDQMLYNEGAIANPWVGDDFEIFLDANPLDKQYQKGTNENFIQFIFIPQHVYGGDGVFIMAAGRYPGVKAASRLTPTGYDIEIAIPKDILPNWKANPALGSIGFDIQVGDIDTIGLNGHDAGPKSLNFLLSPIQHFLSTEFMGTLNFEAKPGRTAKPIKKPAEFSAGAAQAQKLLDRFDDPTVTADANAALARHDLSRRAALYLFMRRPDLKMDIDKAIAVLGAKPLDGESTVLDASRIYAMIALAQRHALPARQVFDSFARSDDLLLRYNALLCLGMNGDKSIVPDLATLYAASKHPHTTELIAVALAQLGDPTGASVLRHVAHRDPGQISGNQALDLLGKLGLAVEPAVG